MRNIIVLFLYLISAEASYREPIEIYEIKETNDRNPSLYVKDYRHPVRGRESETLLSKILRPFNRSKHSVVDKVTKDLLDKLKLLRRNQLQKGEGVYIIDANTLSDDSSTDENNSFVDETRNGNPDLPIIIIPQKKIRKAIQDRPVLRSEIFYRTAPPIHKHPYDYDD